MTLAIETHSSLARLNTFGIAASAERLVRLREPADIAALLADPGFRAGPRLILGGGSNIILTGDFPGTVAKVELRGITARDDGDDVIVEAAAGEGWHTFVRHTLAQGWYGLENLSLIPGTVGACPVQNVGAYGVEVKDHIVAVNAVELASGAAVRFGNADCRFAYRDSLFKQEGRDRYLITSVAFRLHKTPALRIGYGDIARELAAAGLDHPTPLDVSDAICRIRAAKLPDPAELGNAGSFFKNPVVDAATLAGLLARYPDLVHYPAGGGRAKLAAGWLIDRAGWKGRALGPAAVHDRQALVLVNRGGARGADVLALAEAVRAAVREQYGVELEMEPLVV